MKLFKGLSVVLIAMGVAMLVMAGLAFAGDEAVPTKASIWQTVSGFFAIIVGGGGVTLWKKFAIIKDLKEMIQAFIQIPAAIQVFAHTAPEELKSNHDYIAMLQKVDTATDEFADVLAYNPKFVKQAEWLRSIINKDMYTKKVNTDALIAKMNERVPLTKIFDKAIVDMTKK
jgi:hypothetical protein